MRYLTVVFVLAAAAASASAAPAARSADLRRTLEQYHSTVAPVPRQLSPGERAELRRQLSEQARPARRR